MSSLELSDDQQGIVLASERILRWFALDLQSRQVLIELAAGIAFAAQRPGYRAFRGPAAEVRGERRGCSSGAR